MEINSFTEYQNLASLTAIYPGKTRLMGLLYTTLGLAGEAGEMANKVKKILRDDDEIVYESKKKELIGELGDVLWYTAMLATELNVDLIDVAVENLKKLRDRQKRGLLGGSGDSR